MIRWTRPENLHVTMKFFGEVPAEQLDTIVAESAETARPFPRGALRLGKTGIFPHRDRMIFWAGLDACDWVAPLGQALSNESRPFKPHVTLGRMTGRPAKDLSMKDLFRLFQEEHLPQTIQETSRLVLYESKTLADGPNYREITTIVP